MSTAYNQNFPNPTDSPANDVQTMQNNAMAIYNIWDIDHYTFNDASVGWHAQVTFPLSNIPPAPSAPSSIAFTASPQDAGLPTNTVIGGASSVSEVFYRNSQCAFLLSGIKAFGVFTTTAGTTPTTVTNGMNVSSSVTKTSAHTYLVTITTNSINGTNIVVIPTVSANGSCSWSLSGDIITIDCFSNFVGPQISFVVLQA